MNKINSRYIISQTYIIRELVYVVARWVWYGKKKYCMKSTVHLIVTGESPKNQGRNEMHVPCRSSKRTVVKIVVKEMVVKGNSNYTGKSARSVFLFTAVTGTFASLSFSLECALCCVGYTGLPCFGWGLWSVLRS